jgi:hypothetical protein
VPRGDVAPSRRAAGCRGRGGRGAKPTVANNGEMGAATGVMEKDAVKWPA